MIHPAEPRKVSSVTRTRLSLAEKERIERLIGSELAFATLVQMVGKPKPASPQVGKKLFAFVVVCAFLLLLFERVR